MNRRCQQGFTVIELLIAASLMAVVGVVLVGATIGFTNAYRNSQDYYHCLQSGRVNMFHLEDTVRKGLLVVYADEHALWVWREDTTGDGLMNLSETSLFTWDAARQELREYRLEYPAGWSAARRAIYDAEIPSWYLTSNSESLEGYFEGSAFSRGIVLAEGVTEFTLQVTPESPHAEFVAITMTVQRGRRAVTVRSAVTMRDNWAAYVKWNGSQWELDRY